MTQNALVIALAVVLIPGSLCAGWKRHISDGKGERFDAPPAHSLNYFENEAAAENLCSGCRARERATVRADPKVRAEVRPVGTLRGIEVFDVMFYDTLPGQDREELAGKSILVKSGPDEYHEIRFIGKVQVDMELGPSTILESGAGTLLGTSGRTGGHPGGVWSAYFWLEPDGATEIDTKALFDAANSVLPRGMEADQISWDGPGTFRDMRLKAGVTRGYYNNCSDCGGSVEVSFALDKGHLRITGKRYLP
jgi:hypothetical protein